jgi:branched-chain amino acid transport system substrate-binding protein
MMVASEAQRRGCANGGIATERRGGMVGLVKRLVLSLGFVLSFLLVSCDRGADEVASSGAVEFINIGVFLPLKGEGMPDGDAALEGIAMAAEEATRSGGVLGRPLRLVVRDTKSSEEASIEAVKLLVEEDKVVALIGGLSEGGTAAVAEADRLGVPVVAIASTLPGVPEREPWVFRPSYVDFLSGGAMASVAASLGVRRCVVLYDPASAYAKKLALDFGKAFKRGRAVTITGEPFRTGATDFREHIERIKAKNPEAVYLPAPGALAGAILKQARKEGLDVPFLGAGTWDSAAFLANAGGAAENCYLPARFLPDSDSKMVGVFNDAFRKKHEGRDPSALSALGYDAVAILARAIQSAGGTDPAAIQQELAGIRNFPGLTGPITAAPESAITRPVNILKVENGKFVYLETIEP